MSALSNTMVRLGRRARTLGWSAAVTWAVFTAIAVVLGWAWMDVVMDAPGAVRLAGFAVAAVAATGVLAVQVKRAAAGWREETLVRRLDAAGAAQGQIVSGFDLAGNVVATGVGEESLALTRGLAQLAIDRAGELSGRASLREALPAKSVQRALLALGAVVLAVGLITLAAPGLVRSEWSRLTDPQGDHPIYSTLQIEVQPGDVKVVYGGDVDIRAVVKGGAVDRLETVLVAADGTQEVVPMFSESGGIWRTSLANVTTPGRYFVQAHQTRSTRFSIGVITVPRITGVTARIVAPAYTHLPPAEGAIPAGGISALPETTVEFRARSNRPLSGGTLTVTAGGAPGEIMLAPVAGTDGTEVRGTLKVKDTAKLALLVTDVAGQRSTESFATTITLLSDERPFVRIVEPRTQSFATPNAVLPVELMAEDDYGITSITLYRSLNDSRSIGLDLPVAAGALPRQRGNATVPLAGLGLKPGDVIRLTGRAEDNDPAGAKGSESPVTQIQIISQEDYNKMMLARAGLEMLLSKYEQAQRRLETQEANLRKMKEELGKLPPDSPLADEMRKKADEMAEAAINDANAVDEAHDLALPFDIDKTLTPRLEDVSKQLRAMASRLKGGTGNAASVKDEMALLDELIKGMDDTQKTFVNEAIVPLEFLAKIYPLLADQQKFIQIYQRENGLAERLAGFTDGTDDPKDKARMRDMETEQRHIRAGLEALLEDIKNHAAALPEDPRIDDFRKSAVAFAEKVGQAGAGDHMSSAETALAAFWGKSGQLEAQAAAKILKDFIAECNSMGQGGQAALKFQPSLSNALGNSIAQLLQAGGLGGGGGYSMPGENGNSVGVYGNMPMGMARGAGNAPGGGVVAGGSVGQTAGPGGEQVGAASARGSNAAVVPVPPQYRRKVDQYFQRVADELQKE